MNEFSRKIAVFQYNPPLRVFSSCFGEKGLGAEDFRFARPKLKRQIAHDRVTRYFQKSGKSSSLST
ncbi:MAG: hypothetical protein ACKVGW_14900 [Verrucomicrobiia bacterium]